MLFVHLMIQIIVQFGYNMKNTENLLNVDYEPRRIIDTFQI